MTETYHEGDMVDDLVEYWLISATTAQLAAWAEKHLRAEMDKKSLEEIRRMYTDFTGVPTT